MVDKHSLAQDKAHSLSEEHHTLDDSIPSVGVYTSHETKKESSEDIVEDIEQEEPEEEVKSPIGGWIAMIIAVLLIAGGLIGLAAYHYKLTTNIPPLLPSVTETLSTPNDRDRLITREFTATVVDGTVDGYEPDITFSIDGTQQEYRFNMHNEGKVALNNTYKVVIENKNNSYWDFISVEQVK